MNEGGQIGFRQQFHQLDESAEVGSIDQIEICLERIGAISNAIEDGARANIRHQVARRGEINQIGFQNVAAVDPFETPGGERADNAENVLAVFEQLSQKVCADKAARAKHHNWSAQGAHPVGTFQHRQLANVFAASAIPSGSRLLRRLRKACEP